MSNVFSKHSVTGYVSGQTKPAAGQRLASFNWKTSTQKDSAWFGIKRDSKAVSLPLIDGAAINNNMSVLLPHIQTYLHSVQDKIVRAALEASSDLQYISDEQVSIAAIVDYLEDSDESGRLTKSGMEEWFASNVADSLMVQLAERLGVSEQATPEELGKIEAVMAAFKGKISALAGGKTSYDAKTATQLQKAVALAPEGDVIADRMVARLQKMIDAAAGGSLLDAL